jgi:hypothetical protein
LARGIESREDGIYAESDEEQITLFRRAEDWQSGFNAYRNGSAKG